MPRPTRRTRAKKPTDAKFAEKVFPTLASDTNVRKAIRATAEHTTGPGRAEPQNQTETPEATIKRLSDEVEKFRSWWHEDREKVERLETRLAHLEGTLRSIGALTRHDLQVTHLQRQRDRLSIPRCADDDIPF